MLCAGVSPLRVSVGHLRVGLRGVGVVVGQLCWFAAFVVAFKELLAVMQLGGWCPGVVLGGITDPSESVVGCSLDCFVVDNGVYLVFVCGGRGVGRCIVSSPFHGG